MAANFSIEPTSFFSQANVPRTITVKPTGANTGSTVIKKLRISAPGYDDKIITLTHKGIIP